MSARVAVLVYPGTNSEEETLRILRDVGANAELVHWSRAEALSGYDAYVLPGGFAYEDRIRAGAIAAHDRLTDAVIEAAQAGKLILGICNGAQILLGEHSLRSAARDRGAVFHQQHAIRIERGGIQIVERRDYRHLPFNAERAKAGENIGDVLQVEECGWLIEEGNLRFLRERAREENAFALAA